MSEPERETYFFMHIMKTAGTSLTWAMQQNVPSEHVYPTEPAGPAHVEQYWQVARLREALPQTLGRVELYCGHFPYVVRDLIDASVVIALLRDPVERVVSHLRHCARHFERHRGKPLEEIYEDAWHRPCLFTDYQVKQFALPLGDQLRGHIDVLEIDQAHLDTALDRLHDVDYLGLVERYEEFVSDLFSARGWARSAGRRLQRSPADQADAPESLRRRIETDNEADREFYTRAVELVDQRSRAGDR